jgi:4-oxalocrotonate tautomerase
MPIINIDWVERPVDQKRAVVEKITAAMVEVTGCPPEAVTVIFTDHPKSDVAKAGVLMSER